MSDTDWIAFHRRALLTDGRCALCAESLDRAVALRGGACTRCGADDVHASDGLDSEKIIATIRGGWARWRWPIYALAAVGLLVGSLVPLLPWVLQTAATILAHLFVVRRPLKWLRPLRRALTRLTLTLAMTALAILGLLLNVATVWMPGLYTVAALFSGIGVLVVYVEVALWLVGHRLRREARSGTLDAWEWAIPLTIGTITVGSAVAMLAGSYGLLWLIYQAQIPGAAQIAEFLLDS
jgi:hypothetical protein